MQIEVKPGVLYFLKWKEEGRARELLAGLRTSGHRVLVVSPRDPEMVRNDLECPADNILTLTESAGQHSVDPQNLMVITDTVMKFIEENEGPVLYIDDLTTLKDKNEFPKVLRLIGFIYESLAMNRGIGFVIIDQRSWDERELAHLGKEGSMVEERDRLDLKSLHPHASKTHATQNV